MQEIIQALYCLILKMLLSVFKQTPFLKRVLVSKHIIEIHAIEPSVFEFSPHERIIIRVNGGDFKA